MGGQTNGYVLPKYYKDSRILIRDSTAIQECQRVNFQVDTANREVWEVTTPFYTFTDLRTKSHYEYSTLSDTARILRKYSQPDSVMLDCGWNFWYYHDVVAKDSLLTLPDTTIGGVTFKRMKSDKWIEYEGEKMRSLTIMYMRCDKKGTIIHLDRRFDEKYSCPLVMYEYKVGTKFPWIKEELEYTTSPFSEDELRVFAAWEQNARRNPAK
jgi:hypothetical protein